MERDFSFLPHFLKEDIYVVNEKPSPTIPESNEKNAVEEQPESEDQAPLKILGANLKNCLIFVNTPGSDVIAPTEKDLLENILKSVKLQPEDVLIVNVKDASNEQIEALVVEQNYRWLIDFGTDRIPLLNSINPYQPLSEGKQKCLKANTLTVIGQDVEKKKLLWASLQEMFLR